MHRSRIKQAAVSIAVSATITAIIGVATGASASSDDNNDSQKAGPVTVFAGPPPGAAFGRVKGGPKHGRKTGFAVGPIEGPIGGPPVHSEMVVPTRDGKDFETVTQDSGKVDSVSGDQLTITEGTEEATYKTVTVDVPGDAKVVRNGKEVDLGDLQAGDKVHVSQSPEDSFVFATDSSFFKKMSRHFRGHVMPPPPAFGGIPPGLPPAPRARRGD
jgi:hypothetical protein